MNPKLRENIKKFGPLVNLLVMLVLLYFIWIEVHWSVAVMMAWMAYSISSFATGLNKFRAELLYKIKAVKQYAQENQGNFDHFINTVNKQAEEFKQHGHKCVECEKYPGQIRNGSIHNSADPKCQIHIHRTGPNQIPPELLKGNDRPTCKICEKEGLPDLYKHNNCPIHN